MKTREIEALAEAFSDAVRYTLSAHEFGIIQDDHTARLGNLEQTFNAFRDWAADLQRRVDALEAAQSLEMSP